MPSGDSSASPVVDLLLSRRSLVAEMHVPPGPSPEELDTILRCATRVPDHKRLTPWRIKVYVGEAKARLGRIFQVAYRASHPDASPDELATEAGRPNRSPLLLVVHTHIEDTDKVPRSEQLLSGGGRLPERPDRRHSAGLRGPVADRMARLRPRRHRRDRCKAGGRYPRLHLHRHGRGVTQGAGPS